MKIRNATQAGRNPNTKKEEDIFLKTEDPIENLMMMIDLSIVNDYKLGSTIAKRQLENNLTWILSDKSCDAILKHFEKEYNKNRNK